MIIIRLTERQSNIVQIVRDKGPITGEDIADILGLTRSALRPDLAILTKAGVLDARPRVGYYYSGKPTLTMVMEEISKLNVNDFKAVPIVVTEKTSVYDAIVNLFVEDVGSLIVVSEGGALEGILSRKDLLKTALGQGDLHKIPVGVIMTRMPNIITIDPEETLLAAAKKIVEHQIDSLPVIVKENNNGKEVVKVVGKISKTTIARVFVELGEGFTMWK